MRLLFSLYFFFSEAVAELRDTGFDTTSSAGSDSDLEAHNAPSSGANNEELASNCSGDTEGPETGPLHSDEDDENSQHRNKSSAANNCTWPYNNPPDGNDTARQQHATAAGTTTTANSNNGPLPSSARRSSDSDFDRHHAREFARKLATQLVPRLLRLRTSVEVDQAMQEFASVVCVENAAAYSDADYNLTAINADGIYLATCAALLLSWQLQQAGHYDAELQHHRHHHQQHKQQTHQQQQTFVGPSPVKIPLTEQQFVTSVQNTGVLVYLSTFWLCELYQCIIASDPLARLPRSAPPASLADITADSTTNIKLPQTAASVPVRCALVELLHDAGGFGATQMLSEWQRLQVARKAATTGSSNSVSSAAGNNSGKDDDVDSEAKRRDAAKKLSRRLLTCCWDSMVTILSAGLGDSATATTAKSRLVQTLSHRTLGIKKLRSGVALAGNSGSNSNSGGIGMNGLGLGGGNMTSSDALFALSLDGLHAAATLSNCLNLQHLAGKILALLASYVCQTSGPRLTASQALSMDVMLVGGLELGSYSPDCWQPVFRVCRHVTQMEHELFSLVQQNVAASSTGASGTTIAATAGTTTIATAAAAAAAAASTTTGEDGGGVTSTSNSERLILSSCPMDEEETW